MEKLKNKYIAFSTALQRLKEAIDMYQDEKNLVLLDGTIQRFEFTVELAWKMIKEYLEFEKMGEFNSPRSTIKEAYRVNLIENGETWLDMLDDRNLTSHTYDEVVAKEIYHNIIKKYYEQFTKLEKVMKDIIDEEQQ